MKCKVPGLSWEIGIDAYLTQTQRLNKLPNVYCFRLQKPHWLFFKGPYFSKWNRNPKFLHRYPSPYHSFIDGSRPQWLPKGCSVARSKNKAIKTSDVTGFSLCVRRIFVTLDTVLWFIACTEYHTQRWVFWWVSGFHKQKILKLGQIGVRMGYSRESAEP